MTTRIQIRRDTSSNWTNNNPTPAEGEPCYETDTGKFKIGDGATAWADLAYQGEGSSITVDSELSTTSTNPVQNAVITSNINEIDTELMTVKADLTTAQSEIVSTQADVASLDETTSILGTYNEADKLVQLDSSGKLPALDGSALTNISADAPSNMVTTDTTQTITGTKTFNGSYPEIRGTGSYDARLTIYGTGLTGNALNNDQRFYLDTIGYTVAGWTIRQPKALIRGASSSTTEYSVLSLGNITAGDNITFEEYSMGYNYTGLKISSTGGSSVEVVDVDSSATTGQAADAKSVYDLGQSLTSATLANATSVTNITAQLNGKTLWTGTASEYAAITTKDSNTIYFITEESES